MRCLSVILFLQILFCCDLFSQGTQYRFSRIDIRNGLSNNQINSILRDDKGFMWFGTSSGLNRYDGYKFKVFKHIISDSTSIGNDIISRIWEGPDNKIWVQARDHINFYDRETETFSRDEKLYFAKIGIPDSAIDDIKKDKKGYYWFVHTTAGLLRYDSKTEKSIHFTHTNNDETTICDNNVTAFAENGAGDFWIIHGNGVMEKMDGKTNKVVYRNGLLVPYFSGNSDFQIFIDAQDELWCYVTTVSNGVFHFNPSQNKLTHISKESSPQLNNNIINGVTQDGDGLVWICTDHGGINIYNKENNSIRYLINNEDDDKTIAQNAITAVYRDSSGIIWAGTYKQGVSYYRENIIKFPLFRHQPSNPTSLSYDDVNRFVEDVKGNIWIGTNGGGLIYFNRQTNQFTRYTHSNSNPNSIGNDVIVSLWIDQDQKLWIGSYYGGLDCFDGKNFVHYKHNEADPASISDDRIWEIFEDSKQRLWIGTLGNGIDLFDRNTKTFTHHRKSDGYLQTNYIAAITEDRAGNIWFGTDAGIDVLDNKTSKFIHLSHNDNGTSLSNNFVMTLLQDSRGMIWAGSSEGITIFDIDRKVVKILRVSDGLPDNNILNILEDNNHNVWISTRNGICKISISGNSTKDYAYRFQNFDEQDGLQGREFNENAALKTKKGELMFGGANGFNLFDPSNIQTNKSVPAIAFTDFLLFNKTIAVGEKVGKHVVLDKSISETKQIILKHNENVFSIEFAALSYSNTEKSQYMYMLEGFDKEWTITDGKNRKATYTNLSPGTYTFKVKASNDDGVWNEKGITMTIKVLPPFWKTPLAYLLYLLVIGGVLYFARFRILQRARTKFALEQERHQAQRLHELDMLKIKFLTNVSHEFRTPLSLILTPLERMLKFSGDDEKKQLQLIYRNARRLLNLVNQLLDFRKMEVKELKLQTRQGDIVQFMKDIAQSFTDLADKKNIRFSVTTNVEHFITFFDHDKIERILFNLLSNAFKFTPENKTVDVSVLLKAIHADNATHLLTVTVNDTGIGMENDKKEKIFDRFFQNEIPGTLINQGSGIGLAITKEFVKLHNGSISVHSILGEGSTFEVALPLKEVVHAPVHIEENIISEVVAVNGNNKHIETEQHIVPAEIEIQEEEVKGNSFSKKPTVLLVEDNDDFRFYLKDNLREHFNILEAENGKVGWQKALASHPELVVSDISMPVMDGIELCKKLKADKRTAHIPVILLTALTGEDQQLRGLETGANDYMTKPFNFEILQSRIKNLLSLQTKMRKTYQKQMEVKPADVEISSPDEKFLTQALEVVEKNISNPDFSVEDLSKAMFMSRVALYKKLLTLSGKSPIDFIRDIRLKRAAQLLEKSKMTVSEIAYEVGFNDPKYFAKYFKKEFGVTPSAYARTNN
ncbi:two-component regulator propeller domain-containing protein [Chitinophagaceae bacterium 26-R-25]|nr:two-component regulator propeller domain-containing protein [Chitinophagaceae bacterium 26-R-25]